MPVDSYFSVEFPANRGYIPFVQEFLRDYLKSFGFNKEFAEYATNESSSWFCSVISEDKFLHAMPTVSFNYRSSGYIISIQIKTSDKKEFMTSLNSQNLSGVK